MDRFERVENFVDSVCVRREKARMVLYDVLEGDIILGRACNCL